MFGAPTSPGSGFPETSSAQRAIELTYRFSGLDKMREHIAAMDRLKQSTTAVTQGQDRFANATAASMSKASASVEHLTQAVSTLGSTLRNAFVAATAFASVSRIIGLGSGQESQEMSLAGTLNAFGMGRGDDPGAKYRDSRAIAASMLDRVRTNAAALPGEASDYMRALPGMLTPLVRAGQNTDQIADFVSNITAVAQGYNIPGDQVGRDMGRILNGQGSSQERVQQEILNPILTQRGISSQQFKAMTARQRVSTISGLMGNEDAQGRAGFGAMITASQDTWGAQIGTFKSNMEDIVRQGTSAVFGDLKDILKGINEYTERFKDNFIQAVRQGGQIVRMMRPLLPLLAASRASSLLTGHGLMSNFGRFNDWSSGLGLGGRARSAAGGLVRGGRAVGGAGANLVGGLAGTGADAARTLWGWGRDGGAAALQGGRGLAGRAATWVATSRPVGALGRAARAVGGEARNIGNYVAGGLWGGPDSLMGWGADYTRGARHRLGRIGGRIRSDVGAIGEGIGALGGAVGSRISRGASALGAGFSGRFHGALALARFRGGGMMDAVSSGVGRVWNGGTMGAIRATGRNLWGGAGALASAAGARMGVDVSGVAGRAAGRFSALTSSLSRAAAAAGGLGGRAGSAFAKILPAMGSMVSSMGKFVLFAAAITVIVAGVREIMHNAEAQRRIMAATDRAMGSINVLMRQAADMMGTNVKDVLPELIETIISKFSRLLIHLMSVGEYIGEVLASVMNGQRPSHSYGYFLAQNTLNAARESQRYHNERQTARAARRTGEASTSGARVNQDFRGSHIHLHNHFSPGYDPDRIAVSFTSRISEMGRRRLNPNLGPLFSVR